MDNKPKVTKNEFDALKYGKMLFTKSHQSRENHFTFVISDQPEKMIGKSRCKPLHLGMTISSKDSASEYCMKIESSKLPEEVQDYYRSKGNLKEFSYLRIDEPVSFEIKHIERIYEFDATNYQPLNSSVCRLMCSDKYLFHNLLINEVKFGGFYFSLGNMCCCENYGCNTANEIKLVGPCCVVNNCPPNVAEIDRTVIELRLFDIDSYLCELEIQKCNILTGVSINYNCSIPVIESEIECFKMEKNSLLEKIGQC